MIRVGNSLSLCDSKNHSEKVYFFGVVFLCAILPYFTAFASLFFPIFCIKCTMPYGFS